MQPGCFTCVKQLFRHLASWQWRGSMLVRVNCVVLFSYGRVESHPKTGLWLTRAVLKLTNSISKDHTWVYTTATSTRSDSDSKQTKMTGLNPSFVCYMLLLASLHAHDMALDSRNEHT